VVRRPGVTPLGTSLDEGVSVALPFADELFFLAHDDRTGKPRLNERVMGLTLAAGLIGELLLQQNIEIHDSRVIVTNPPPPIQELTRAVFDNIAGQVQPRMVRTWIAVFGEQARESIGLRLMNAGLVRRERARWPGWPSHRFVPVDPNTAFAGTARINVQMSSFETMPPTDVFLGGIAVTAMLGRHVLSGGGRRAEEQLQEFTATLPPACREVITALESTIVEVSMIRR
jgi:hypothetical protein